MNIESRIHLPKRFPHRTEHSLPEELDATEDGLSYDRDSRDDSVKNSTKNSRPVKEAAKGKDARIKWKRYLIWASCGQFWHQVKYLVIQ